MKVKITLEHLFFPILFIIILSCSCSNNNKDENTVNIDTIIPEPVTPPISKLTQAERELERTKSLMMIKDLEISHRSRDVDLAIYATTLNLDSIEKEIAIEKMNSAKNVLDQSLEDKKNLENKMRQIEKEIDSLKINK